MGTCERMAVCLVVSVALVLGVPCGAAAFSLKIAASGDVTPDGYWFGSMFSSPRLNESGQVLFKSDLAAPAMGYGLYLYNGPFAGATVARDGDSAPGGGTWMVGMGDTYSLNNLGQVAFHADVNQPPMGMKHGIFRGDGAGVTPLVWDGDPAPNTGGTFSLTMATVPPAMNDSGQVVFYSQVTGGMKPWGLFRADGATVTDMVLGGDPAPDTGGGVYGMLFAQSPGVSEAGEVAFTADIMGGSPSGGVFRTDGTTDRLIAGADQAAPGTGGGTFMAMFSTPAINAAGQVAFSCDVMDGTAMSGIWRGDGSVLDPIAVGGQAAPDGNGEFGMFGNPAINGAGQVAFSAMLIGTLSPGMDSAGIWRGDGTGITKMARSGDVVPDGNGIIGFTGAMTPYLNDGGLVAFVADLTETAGALMDNRGIFLADGVEVVQVARKGEAAGDVGGSRITNLNLSGMGGMPGTVSGDVINSYGQVVYLADYDDGSGGSMRSGVFLYTPELHWRSGASGSWDTTANWTLGLRPAYVHRLIIDPTTNVTITGPAADTTVDTIGIWPIGGATADLVLSGGNLTAQFVFMANGGTLTLESGTLTASTMHVYTGGTFNGAGGALNVQTIGQYGGAIDGLLDNRGTFNYGSGDFRGRLLNRGNVTWGGSLVLGDGMANEAGLQLGGFTGSVELICNGQGLRNDGSMTLWVGAILGGDGPLVNNGRMDCLAYYWTTTALVSTIAGTGGFTNNGYMTVVPSMPEATAVDLVLSNTGTNTNVGTIDLATGRQLRLEGAALGNRGALNLNGALITGTGTLTNMPGGVLAGPGTISAPFGNDGLVVVDEGALHVVEAFTNTGTVRLDAGSAALMGGKVTNSGTIEGRGHVSSDVDNSGIIEPVGGTLSLSGAVLNLPAGTISATAGSKVLATGIGGPNEGTISLAGGTFDTGGRPMTNDGLIAGYGVFRSGGLTNNNAVVFSGGTATVNGPVVNALDARMTVAYQPAVFTGNVANYGEFKVTDTTVTFAGTYSEYGTYLSDPAYNCFSDVSVGATGAFIGGAGDRFLVRGDLLSSSANAAGWDTAEAELIFQKSADHRHVLGVTGEDRGAVPAGRVDNFAWGKVTVQAGETVALADGNAAPGGALYVRDLAMEAGSTLDLAHLNLHVSGVLANAGTLDLTTSNLVVDYDTTSPMAAIAAMVASGLSGGTWNGMGITSADAAAEPDGLTAVGVLDNTDEKVGGKTAFEGEPVDATAVLVKYTWWGDANLDGVVDANDYDVIDKNFLFTPEPDNMGWWTGDYNYDGVIDANDYDRIDRAFLFQAGPLGAGDRAASVPTPEPATLALLAVGALALVRRRRA